MTYPTKVAMVRLCLDFGLESVKVFLEDELVLGRRMPEGEQGIDLSPYGAYELGVSRIHASLSLEDGLVYLEDLGSDEGTRLGDTLLLPFSRYLVKNGDCISLGGLRFMLTIC